MHAGFLRNVYTLVNFKTTTNKRLLLCWRHQPDNRLRILLSIISLSRRLGSRGRGIVRQNLHFFHKCRCYLLHWLTIKQCMYMFKTAKVIVPTPLRTCRRPLFTTKTNATVSYMYAVEMLRASIFSFFFLRNHK